MNKSSGLIVKLLDYDIVFTTSFENKHGVSGHLYEIIDYFFICFQSGLKCGIILTDGTDKETLKRAIEKKYNFSSNIILEHTLECFNPGVIITKNLCIVDGAARFNNCTIYCDNIFLFRCSHKNFNYFSNHKTIKRTHLFQDFNVYEERFEDLNIDVIDYNKKILWQYYNLPKLGKTNTALLYLTTNCRALSTSEVNQIMHKYRFDKYLIVTNELTRYSDLESENVSIEKAPISNIFEKFDTYIYTSTTKKFDCSPRFIVECSLYNKNVIYEIDYYDSGLETRKKDMKSNLNSLMLTTEDFFVNYLKDIL
jgi:hypothetical protein